MTDRRSPLTQSTLVLLAAAALLANATACGPNEDPDTYSIVFALGSSPDDLASLKFRVLYDGGDIAGNGAAAACDLVAADDDETVVLADDDDGELVVEIHAEDNPLLAAEEILVCDFVASSQPSPDDFAITILAATDSEDDPLGDLSEVGVVVTSTEIEAAAVVQAPATTHEQEAAR